jgi:glycosyltransferase involved in cell wall biosynthesis
VRGKKKFAAFLDAYAPDVIHVHNIYHQLSFSIFDAAKKRGIPIVMTLHDYKMMSPNYMMYHHGHVDMSMIGKKYYRCVLNNCMEAMGQSIVATVEAYVRGLKRWATQIAVYLAPSEFMAGVAERSGLPVSKIAILRNPISLQKEVGDKKTDKGPVLYVGRLSKEKGLDALLSAAANTPHIQYVIAGDGPEKKYLETQKVGMNLKNVDFVGYQRGEALQALYRNAGIVVLPSVWHENAPMVIVEAVSAGTIVIGSDIGGIPEFLPPELLFEPGNSVHLADRVRYWHAASAETRQQMVTSLRDVLLERHSPHVYIKKLLAYYATAIGS